MFKELFAIVGAAALFTLPRVVIAQEEQPPAPESPPVIVPQAPQPSIAPLPPEQPVCPPGTTAVYQPTAPPMVMEPAPGRRGQQSLTVGGGVADFVRERIATNTGAAGAWDVRYLAGTRSYVGFEAGYLGTANGVDSSVGGGSLVTTQVSGSMRLNLSRSRFQPFLTAGAGWANLHRSSTTELSDLGVTSRSTNSFVAPFSWGVAGYLGRHTVLDVRGSYNLITNKDYAPLSTIGEDRARADMWAAEMRLGYAF